MARTLLDETILHSRVSGDLRLPARISQATLDRLRRDYERSFQREILPIPEESTTRRYRRQLRLPEERYRYPGKIDGPARPMPNSWGNGQPLDARPTSPQRPLRLQRPSLSPSNTGFPPADQSELPRKFPSNPANMGDWRDALKNEKGRQSRARQRDLERKIKEHDRRMKEMFKARNSPIAPPSKNRLPHIPGMPLPPSAHASPPPMPKDWQRAPLARPLLSFPKIPRIPSVLRPVKMPRLPRIRVPLLGPLGEALPELFFPAALGTPETPSWKPDPLKPFEAVPVSTAFGMLYECIFLYDFRYILLNGDLQIDQERHSAGNVIGPVFSVYRRTRQEGGEFFADFWMFFGGSVDSAILSLFMSFRVLGNLEAGEAFNIRFFLKPLGVTVIPEDPLDPNFQLNPIWIYTPESNAQPQQQTPLDEPFPLRGFRMPNFNPDLDPDRNLVPPSHPGVDPIPNPLELPQPNTPGNPVPEFPPVPELPPEPEFQPFPDRNTERFTLPPFENEVEECPGGNCMSCRFNPAVVNQIAQNAKNEAMALALSEFAASSAVTKAEHAATKSAIISRVAEGVTKNMERFDRLANWLKLPQIVNTLTLIVTLHNAAMLSSQLAETLLSVVSNGLSIIGIEDENGNAINIGQVLGRQASDVMRSILGDKVWNDAVTKWKSANRMYQSASNIIWSVSSIADSARSLQEFTAEQVGKIGNALRRDGVVRENSYRAMPENVTARTALQRKLDRMVEGIDKLDSAAGSLATATGEIIQIKEEVKEIKEARAEFNKGLQEFSKKQDDSEKASKKASSSPEPSEKDQE